MVGSAIVRRLASEKCTVLAINSKELDLTRQNETERWIEENKPDAVFLAAGLVGEFKPTILCLPSLLSRI